MDQSPRPKPPRKVTKTTTTTTTVFIPDAKRALKPAVSVSADPSENNRMPLLAISPNASSIRPSVDSVLSTPPLARSFLSLPSSALSRSSLRTPISRSHLIESSPLAPTTPTHPPPSLPKFHSGSNARSTPLSVSPNSLSAKKLDITEPQLIPTTTTDPSGRPFRSKELRSSNSKPDIHFKTPNPHKSAALSPAHSNLAQSSAVFTRTAGHGSRSSIGSVTQLIQPPAASEPVARLVSPRPRLPTQPQTKKGRPTQPAHALQVGDRQLVPGLPPLEALQQWRARFNRLVLFFDSVDVKKVQQYTKAVKQLGARVAIALGAEVTHMVSGHPNVKEKVAMMRNPDHMTREEDNFTICKRLGIKVWPLPKLDLLLRSLSRDQLQPSNGLQGAVMQELMHGISTHKHGSRSAPYFHSFSSPFLLVEDSTYAYRPIIAKEFPLTTKDDARATWPTIRWENARSHLSIFVPHDQARSRKQPTGKDLSPLKSQDINLHGDIDGKHRQGSRTSADEQGPIADENASASYVDAKHRFMTSMASASNSQAASGLVSMATTSAWTLTMSKDSRGKTRAPLPSLGHRTIILDKTSQVARPCTSQKRKLSAVDIHTTEDVGPTNSSQERTGRKSLKPTKPTPRFTGKSFYKRPGYCENCNEKYDEFRKHILTPTHQSFVRSCDQKFRDLDALCEKIVRVPLPSPSRSSPELDENHPWHDSTKRADAIDDANNELETGISETPLYPQESIEAHLQEQHHTFQQIPRPYYDLASAQPANLPFQPPQPNLAPADTTNDRGCVLVRPEPLLSPGRGLASMQIDKAETVSETDNRLEENIFVPPSHLATEVLSTLPHSLSPTHHLHKRAFAPLGEPSTDSSFSGRDMLRSPTLRLSRTAHVPRSLGSPHAAKFGGNPQLSAALGRTPPLTFKIPTVVARGHSRPVGAFESNCAVASSSTCLADNTDRLPNYGTSSLEAPDSADKCKISVTDSIAGTMLSGSARLEIDTAAIQPHKWPSNSPTMAVEIPFGVEAYLTRNVDLMPISADPGHPSDTLCITSVHRSRGSETTVPTAVPTTVPTAVPTTVPAKAKDIRCVLRPAAKCPPAATNSDSVLTHDSLRALGADRQSLCDNSKSSTGDAVNDQTLARPTSLKRNRSKDGAINRSSDPESSMSSVSAVSAVSAVSTMTSASAVSSDTSSDLDEPKQSYLKIYDNLVSNLDGNVDTRSTSEEEAESAHRLDVRQIRRSRQRPSKADKISTTSTSDIDTDSLLKQPFIHMASGERGVSTHKAQPLAQITCKDDQDTDGNTPKAPKPELIQRHDGKEILSNSASGPSLPGLQIDILDYLEPMAESPRESVIATEPSAMVDYEPAATSDPAIRKDDVQRQTRRSSRRTSQSGTRLGKTGEAAHQNGHATATTEGCPNSTLGLAQREREVAESPEGDARIFVRVNFSKKSVRLNYA